MNFYLKEGYIDRDLVPDFDDTSFKDEWQDEVYRWAEEVYSENSLDTIIDIGTGSGYKLNKYFRLENSIGIDSPNTVSYLNDNYPHGNWKEYGQVDYSTFSTDLVLAIDVIEHVKDPFVFLEQISTIQNVKYYLLSTPERDVKWGTTHNGPPPNNFHYREWNTIEFIQLISQYFTPLEHRIMNFKQGTQSLLCVPR